MKVLGCTGGIGSGKSYVANIFNRMGIPVYDSDNRAKGLYDTDTILRGQMVELLGSDEKLDYIRDDKALTINVNGEFENDLPICFKIAIG